MANRLIKEKSPYLLSHAENPVDWYPWGEEAFKAAREKDIPVFLSIGYSSCHWCHVMEKESFMDDETAQFMNKNYISIKVDREEMPDIDNFYMEACEAFNSSAGWPLSAFLNYDKVPFYAGTYYPREDMPYRMGFKTLLNRITTLWNDDREKLTNTGQAFIDFLNTEDNINSESNVWHYSEVLNKLNSVSDKRFGGFMGAPKFPTASKLMFLLQYNIINRNSNAKELLEINLEKMATGGIFDHIGGGFFRYSTDDKWLVPHFEKMLYDNALLLYVYSAASVELNSRFKHIADKIASYLLSDMQNDEGGFFTAEDADSEGVEGKHYVFSKEEIINILGNEGEKFCNDYDITIHGNFEGFNIPNRIKKSIIPEDSRIKKVLEYRKKRVAPLKDDKIIASSNGFVIAALSLAGRVFNNCDYIKSAEKTARYVLDNMIVNGRLMISIREGEARHFATLEDYGAIIWGLLELYESTHTFYYLDMSIKLADNMIDLFNDNSGGFYLTGEDNLVLPLRLKKYNDSAIISGNALAALCLNSIYQHIKEEKYKNAYDQIIEGASLSVLSSPLSCFGLINARMIAENSTHIGISTGKGIENIYDSLPLYRPFTITTLYDEEFIKRYKSSAVLSDSDVAKAFVCDSHGCRAPLDAYELKKAM